MENCDVFYDSCPHNNLSNQSVEKDTTKTRKANSKDFRTICDISNVDRCRSEKLIKPNVARKYRSVYLKKYVWSKGVRYYRRYKKAFVIPVIHVSRRPDNPFNVKSVVENLKRKQMTSPLHKTTDSNQHLSVGEELCYSNLEKQIVKTRNWEAIRYKYQLDYKERLKMERENYLKKCADMKKISQKQHSVEHMRQFHPNMDECIRKGPYSAVVSNEELIVDPVHSNRHIGERQKNLVSSTETAAIAGFNGVTSVANESKNYYPHIKYDDSVCKSIDSTDAHKSRNPFNGGEVEQMQFNRNERGENIQSEVKQNKVIVESNTVIVSPPKDHEMPKKSQDFDFSIPFNESNILVKVMTPDRKNPSNVSNQRPQPQPHSLLQNTLLHDTKPTKQDSSSKRVVSVEESKTNNIRHSSGPRSEWLQYIQNLLNKTTKLADHPAETSKPSLDHRPIPTTTIQKPSVAHVNTTNSQLTRHPDPQSIGRVKVDRPMVTNPRLIRPKVMHPSPYYRSHFFRNNPLYNEPMEDPVVLNMPVRQHSPASLIPDQPSIPPHIEYTYANHPNYQHDFMVRNMQLPFDMSHANIMGQPMYSPYDHPYMQYPIEMERMPHPYMDRFVQHNNVPPPNRSIGFLPPRPIAPIASGVYRYLNPQHDHPLWIYPHVLER